MSSLLLLGCSHGSDDPPLPPVPDNPDQPDEPDNPDDPDPEPVLVPIELYTSLLSRAAIDKFDGTPVGIAMGSSTNRVDEQWDALAGEKQLNLSSVHYYPTDSSLVYLWGFHPRTPLVEGVARYRLTGKEDILYADVQSGSLHTPFSVAEKQIVFRHVLAQLNVSLETTAEFEGSYRLKYIALDGSAASADLDLPGGNVHFGTESTRIEVYNAPGFTGAVVESGVNLSLGSVLIEPGARLTTQLVFAKDGNAEHDIVFQDVTVEFEGGGSGSGLSYTLPVKLPNKIEPDTPVDPDPDPPIDPDPDPPIDPDPDPPVDPDPDPPVDPDPDEPDDTQVPLQLFATITPWVNLPSGSLEL